MRLIWAYPRKLLKSREETERQLEGLKIKLLKCSFCMGSGQGRESMDKQQGAKLGEEGVVAQAVVHLATSLRHYVRSCDETIPEALPKI